MATPSTIAGDCVITGNVYVGGVIPLPGAGGYITDVLISPTAAIQYSKLQQQHVFRETIVNYGSTVAAVRKTLAIVSGATGAMLSFKVTLAQPLTAGSATVDLLKNGVSVLTGVVTLNTTGGTGGTAYDKVTGSIAAAGLVAGDVLEINVAVAGPTGGGGMLAEAVTKQDP